MIRILLSARTGNNLFQYAAGRALAQLHGVPLIMDTAWSEAQWVPQIEEILQLNLSATYERKCVFLKKSLRKAFKITPWRYHGCHGYQETSAKIDSNFYQLPNHTILDGFFQSPFYFKDIKDILRNEFNFSDLVIPLESQLLEDELSRQITVSLHVRRGDYVNIAPTQCLPENYHQTAIQYYQARFPGIKFCVFSDDIAWCKSAFEGSEFIFCDLVGSQRSALHDLRLMSACNHHIIVNSSYSWWGAWLNSKPDKIVVAPKYWMKNLESTDILESDWIRI